MFTNEDLRHSKLWYEPDGTAKKVSYQNLLDNIAFEDNTFVKWEKVDGVCYCTDALILDKAMSWSPDDYARFVSWLGTIECGNNIAVPFMVDDGAGGETPFIDSEGNYLLVKDTKLYTTPYLDGDGNPYVLDDGTYYQLDFYDVDRDHTWDIDNDTITAPVLDFVTTTGRGSAVELGVASDIPVGSDYTVEMMINLGVYITYANVFNGKNDTSGYGIQRRSGQIGWYPYFVAVDEGTWVKLTIRFAGANRTMFLNGISKISGVVNVSGGMGWSLGTSVRSPGDNHAYVGSMSSIGIYDYAKTDEEILENGTTIPNISDGNLIRFYQGDVDGTNLIESIEEDHGVMVDF